MSDRCLFYYITDGSQFGGDKDTRRRALLAKIAEATVAGVEYIQLREKELSARELEPLAGDARRAMRDVAPAESESGERRTRLLINSRTDVAIAAGADGVHLRSADLSPCEVRAIWHSCGAGARVPAPVVAVSCHSVEEVIQAASDEASIAVFAPVFRKSMTPGVGLAALHKACQAKIPVLALGGVTLENADACLLAGTAGVAGIRIFQQNKIEDVVRSLRAL